MKGRWIYEGGGGRQKTVDGCTGDNIPRLISNCKKLKNVNKSIIVLYKNSSRLVFIKSHISRKNDRVV